MHTQALLHGNRPVIIKSKNRIIFNLLVALNVKIFAWSLIDKSPDDACT